MKRRNTELKIRAIFIAEFVSAAVFTAAAYILSGSGTAAVCCFLSSALMIVLTAVLHGAENSYITEIVSELSDLTDCLTELEEKDIFPENEDSVVSKLQSKVIKLVRILKRKNLMAEQESENVKSLVSDISHQLKTPISNILMYSEFLENEAVAPQQRREYIAELKRSVNRLNFLSESMIKISRLESGIIRMNMKSRSINETVLKAVKDVYSKAKSADTEIVYSADEDITVCHDRNWTAEAVFNLLDNAVKYSRRGAKIYLSVKAYDHFVSVEVRDENAPIPESERAEVFSRFFRGKSSAGKEGIGIGLYLVREIALRQGGYVKLKCSGNGNTFSLVLPLGGAVYTLQTAI